MSTMAEILQRIVDTKGAGCADGLCAELVLADDYDSDSIDSLFETWEHFSGSRVYPVPNPKHPGDPAEARASYEGFGDGEGFLGEYGELRLKLAQHLLGALEGRFGA